MNIINELPGKSDVSKGLDLNISLGTDELKNSLNFDGLKSSIAGVFNDNLLGAIEFPKLPDSFSLDSVLGNLNSPLNNLKSIDLPAITTGIPSAKDLFNMEIPSFDLNGIMNNFLSVLLPFTLSFTSAIKGIESINDPDIEKELSKIINSGAQLPFRSVKILSDIYNSFVSILTDPEKLLNIGIESVIDQYKSNIESIINENPVSCIINLNKTIVDKGFIAKFKNYLLELKITDIKNTSKLKEILQSLENEIIPVFNLINSSLNSMERFAGSETSKFDEHFDSLIKFSESNEIIFNNIFNNVENKIEDFVSKIESPFIALNNATGSIKDFLNNAVEKTESAVSTVSDKIETNITGLNENIDKVDEVIKDIDKKINDFISEIDVNIIINPVKKGCLAVGEKLGEFFSKIEEIKIKLNEGISFIDRKIEEEYSEKLLIVQDKIRELLGNITGILTREEIQDIIQKVDEGLDTFKQKIDEISLTTVFDLVCDKTKDVENKINGINTSKLSSPIKLALKTSLQVVKAVKVEDKLKPYVMDGFQKLQTPVLDLINFVEEKYMVVDNIINDFAPGNIVSDVIKKSDPFQFIINSLESVKPSDLLAPLKEINDLLVSITKELDPDIILNVFQELYDEVSKIVEIISPEQIIKLVIGPLDYSVKQLETIRDNSIPGLLDIVKETVSLEKLLENFQIKEIVNNDFWKFVTYYVGGLFLDDIKKSVNEMLSELTVYSNQINIDEVNFFNNKLNLSIGDLGQLTAVEFENEINKLNGYINVNDNGLKEVFQIWSDILIKYENYPEFQKLSQYIKPAIFNDFKIKIDKLTNIGNTGLKQILFTFKSLSETKNDNLKSFLLMEPLELMIEILKNQFINPVFEIVNRVKEKFSPITESILSIDEVAKLIITIPGKIDQIIISLLNSVEINVKSLIDNIIESILIMKESLSNDITLVYDKLKKLTYNMNPYWILNSFIIDDIIKNDNETFPSNYNEIKNNILTNNDNKLSVFIKSLISYEQIELLNMSNDESLGLIIEIFNSILLMKETASPVIYSQTKEFLESEFERLNTELSALYDQNNNQALPDETQAVIKNNLLLQKRVKALLTELLEAKVAFENSGGKEYTLIRLNRVIIESNFSNYFFFSMQSIYGIMIEQISGFYPAESIKKIDDIYYGIIDKINSLPDELIAVPLEEEYDKLKKIYNEVFSLKDFITIFKDKISKFDDELSDGFDKLFVSFNNMLSAIDQRLS